MSIQITSNKLLGSLQNNRNGETSYYSGVYSKTTQKENKSVQSSISTNSDFRKALNKLKNADYDSGMRSDIKKSVKALVESYNDLADSQGDGSKRYSSKVSSLKSLFSEYSDKLNKVGITLSNGKMTFDEDKFDDAENDDLKEVFSGDSDLVKEASKILRSTNNMIKNKVYSTEKEDVYVSNSVSTGNIAYAAEVNKLVVSVEYLNGKTLTDDNKEEIANLLDQYNKNLQEFYEKLNDTEDWDNVDRTEKADSDVEEILKLQDDYVAAMSDETQPFYYDSWFSSDKASYGQKVESLYKDLFNELVGTAKKDFTVSSYMDYTL